jgi:hypothetical protein
MKIANWPEKLKMKFLEILKKFKVLEIKKNFNLNFKIFWPILTIFLFSGQFFLSMAKNKLQIYT